MRMFHYCLLLCMVSAGSQYAGGIPVTDAYSQEADMWLHLYTESAMLSDARERCQLEGYKVEPRTGSCYKFHRTPRTWYEAYIACHEEYAELAIINSENEAQVLKELFEKAMGSNEVIIGIRRKAGEWVTVEEEGLADAGFDSWAPGEPNNKKGDETCGFMLRSGLLNDDSCDTLSPSICEIEL